MQRDSKRQLSFLVLRWWFLESRPVVLQTAEIQAFFSKCRMGLGPLIKHQNKIKRKYGQNPKLR